MYADWEIFVVTPARLVKHVENNNNNKRPKRLQRDKYTVGPVAVAVYRPKSLLVYLCR